MQLDNSLEGYIRQQAVTKLQVAATIGDWLQIRTNKI